MCKWLGLNEMWRCEKSKDLVASLSYSIFRLWRSPSQNKCQDQCKEFLSAVTYWSLSNRVFKQRSMVSRDVLAVKYAICFKDISCQTFTSCQVALTFFHQLVMIKYSAEWIYCQLLVIAVVISYADTPLIALMLIWWELMCIDKLFSLIGKIFMLSMLINSTQMCLKVSQGISITTRHDLRSALR